MEKTFPTETVVYGGKEYINMKSDVFYAFFKEVAKYSDVSELLVSEIDKRYRHAKTIKRKRIRLKKEKEALIVMYSVIFTAQKAN